MKTRTISLLALILIALACVYYFDYRRMVDREQERFVQERVLAFAAKEAVTLETKGGENPYRLEKRGERWRITSPTAEWADTKRVTGKMLAALDEAQKHSPFDASQAEWETRGLDDKQALRVTVVSASGDKAELRLGGETPLRGDSYVVDPSRPGKIFIVPISLRGSLDQPLVDLLDKSALAFGAQDVAAFTITRHEPISAGPDGTGRLSARRDPATGDWTMTLDGEPAFGADSKLIGLLVGQLRDLRPSDALTSGSAGLSRFGLDREHFTVEVRLAKGDTGTSETALTFAFGQPVPATGDAAAAVETHYARMAGQCLVLTTDASLFESFGQAASSFRDRRLLGMPRREIAYLQIESRRQSFVTTVALTRDPGGPWRLASDPSVRLNQERVASYLTFCQSLRVGEWAPKSRPSTPEEAGLDRPALRITAANAGRGRRAGFEIGSLVSEKGYLRYGRKGDLASEPDIAEVFATGMPEEFLQSLQRSGRYFHERKLVALEKDRVHRVEVLLGRDAATSLTIRRDAGGPSGWKAARDSGRAQSLPRASADLLVQVLNAMEYQVAIPKDSMSPKALELTNMSKPSVQIRIYDASGALVSSLAFASLGEGSESILAVDEKETYFYLQKTALGQVGRVLDDIASRIP